MKGIYVKTEKPQTIADFQISSTQEREFDGDHVVRVEHPSLSLPIDFDPPGAKLLALRLAVCAEMAHENIEGRPRVYSQVENDLQATVRVEAFSSIDGPAVEITIADFQVRTCSTGAMRLAARLAYAAELAEASVDHILPDKELTDELLHAAHFAITSSGRTLFLRAQAHKRSKNQ